MWRALLSGLFALGCAHAEVWQSTVAVEHPLVGTIWSVRASAPVSAGALVSDLASARFVLLGEKHDNPDHQRLQARLVTQLARRDALTAVVFEMLRADVALDLARVGRRSESVRGVWIRGGWPEREAYEPIVEAALAADRSIVAGDLKLETQQRLRADGAVALAPAESEQLGFTLAFPDSRRAALAERIREAHCGYAPTSMLARMIDLQRARDAHLARSLMHAADLGPGAVVLVTGAEHARGDQGAPVALAVWAQGSRVASVLFAEVDLGAADAEALLAERYGEPVPFDYVWFTPRVDALDPCVKFQRELESMGRGAPEP